MARPWQLCQQMKYLDEPWTTYWVTKNKWGGSCWNLQPFIEARVYGRELPLPLWPYIGTPRLVPNLSNLLAFVLLRKRSNGTSWYGMQCFFHEISQSANFSAMQQNNMYNVLCYCEARLTKQRQFLLPSKDKTVKAVGLKEGLPLATFCREIMILCIGGQAQDWTTNFMTIIHHYVSPKTKRLLTTIIFTKVVCISMFLHGFKKTR